MERRQEQSRGGNPSNKEINDKLDQIKANQVAIYRLLKEGLKGGFNTDYAGELEKASARYLPISHPDFNK